MQPPAKRLRVDDVRERHRPVDLDDGNPLPVAALELGVARDVDLLEAEGNLAARAFEHTPGGIAEVAPASRVEDDRGRHERPAR